MPRRRKLKGNRPKVGDFQPRGILANSLQQRRYPPGVVEQVIAASSSLPRSDDVLVMSPFAGDEPRCRQLPPREALAAKLEIATAIFLRDYEWEKRPTASQLRDEMKEISAAATALLKSVGLGTKHRSNPDLIPDAILSVLRQHAGFMHADGETRVLEAITSIKNLHEWVERELWNMEGHPPSRATHKGDRAFNKLLTALAEVWRDIFGRKLDTSLVSGNARTKGRAAGDFFQFVSACLAPLNLPERLTSEFSLATRLIRLKKQISGTEAV